MIYKRQSQPRAEQPVRMVTVRIGNDVPDAESYSQFIQQKNLNAQPPQMAPSQFVPSQSAPFSFK